MTEQTFTMRHDYISWRDTLQSRIDSGWRIVPESVRIEIAMVIDSRGEKQTVERYFAIFEKEKEVVSNGQ